MIKLILKNVPRTWTREQWKEVSRWLRLCQNHINKLNMSTILYNVMIFGTPKRPQINKGVTEKVFNRSARTICDYFKPIS